MAGALAVHTITLHYTTLHYTTLHYTTPHCCKLLHSTSLATATMSIGMKIERCSGAHLHHGGLHLSSEGVVGGQVPVSYTHLTLPTILLV